jgi:methylated-DNA-[protein]-cysteine S-methyltransferase
MSLFSKHFESPLGQIEIRATDDAITAVRFAGEARIENNSNNIADQCAEQLMEYFAGTREDFDLALGPIGTEFEKQIWKELVKVPYGTTCSYLAIANRLSNPKATRAVGRANGANPIAIIVPCHRVIGSDGSLTGYGGELWRKRWLLDHEARVSGQSLL